MRIKNIHGREVNIPSTKYRIDWDKAVSKPQQKVKDALRPYWAGHSVCEEFYIPSSKMRIDLINFTLGIVVEISPKSSHKFNPFFHKNRPKFLESVKRDLKKMEWVLANDFKYVDLTDEEIKNPELILERVNEE